MEDVEFDNILNRLAGVVGSRSPKELAAALGISEQAVYKVLKKKAVPRTWIYRISSKYNIELSCLLGEATAKQEKQTEDALNAPPNVLSVYERCLELYERLYRLAENEKFLLKENADLRVQLKALENRFALPDGTRPAELPAWGEGGTVAEEVSRLHQSRREEELEARNKKEAGVVDDKPAR